MDITFELEHIREALDNIEEYDENNDSLLNEISSSVYDIQSTLDEISDKKKEDISKEELLDVLDEIKYEIGNLYDML